MQLLRYRATQQKYTNNVISCQKISYDRVIFQTRPHLGFYKMNPTDDTLLAIFTDILLVAQLSSHTSNSIDRTARTSRDLVAHPRTSISRKELDRKSSRASCGAPHAQYL
jgi:hypothetical protein